MSSDLKGKLAQVAARLAATQERLRGLERSAAGVRHDLDSLRGEVERATESGATPIEDEWGHHVPTRPLAVGVLAGDGTSTAGRDAAVDADATAAGPRDADGVAAVGPWPER